MPMPRSVPRSERQVLGRVSQGVDMARRLEPSLRLVTHCKKVKQQALAHTLTHKHTFTHTHTHTIKYTLLYIGSRNGLDAAGGTAVAAALTALTALTSVDIRRARTPNRRPCHSRPRAGEFACF